MINKLVIIGVGLIGGSFALALRKAGEVKQIVGVGRGRENMQRAHKMGAIDEISDDLQSALKEADGVLLATPVGQTGRIMAQISQYLESRAIVTDAGSTKQDVVTAARSYMAGHLKNFVPAHPVAGAELSGASAADADLFRGKNLVLTPLEETSAEAVKRVTELWQACGARVSQMSAARHDKIFAAVSHLPHVLAFALMNHIRSGAGQDSDDLLRFAGSGFRDFTRIAGSSPEMWRDICLANREALSNQIDAYQNELTALSEMLARGDDEALESLFANARETQRRWLKNKA
ncbi:MAG: prephenate dehydrogenase/arogenate dehydrogenase family protein [Nitrosospira sp.]|nr:prephenate dehydrogenase/arogenate dehydrogenase family protein [Nitrosospira sp.]